MISKNHSTALPIDNSCLNYDVILRYCKITNIIYSTKRIIFIKYYACIQRIIKTNAYKKRLLFNTQAELFSW